MNVFVRGAVPNPLWQGHVRNLPKSAHEIAYRVASLRLSSSDP